MTRHWIETTGQDQRLTAATDVVIRSLTELETPAEVLTRDVYFDGADILRCSSGRFRFTIDGTRTVELGPEETLVTYPGHRVTIEALAESNRVVYGIFCGNSVEEYLDSFGFFHGIHGKTSSYDELLKELRGLLNGRTGGRAESNPVCLSLLTDILVSMAKDLREQGNERLCAAIRQIRSNLAQGIVRLEPLCEQLRVSRAHLHALFVRAGLESPSAYIRNEQARLVLRLLRTTQLPIADVARKAGFISMTHFANFMRQNTGKSAREWRM